LALPNAAKALRILHRSTDGVDGKTAIARGRRNSTLLFLLPPRRAAPTGSAYRGRPTARAG
jgi:hypothetical protein